MTMVDRPNTVAIAAMLRRQAALIARCQRGIESGQVIVLSVFNDGTLANVQFVPLAPLTTIRLIADGVVLLMPADREATADIVAEQVDEWARGHAVAEAAHAQGASHVVVAQE